MLEFLRRPNLLGAQVEILGLDTDKHDNFLPKMCCLSAVALNLPAANNR
jgi:hypothetical protein